MSKPWPRVKLGEVLTRSGETAQPAVNAKYKEITIRLWGKGVVERGRVAGASIMGKRFVARQGQFIASRIDARNGAMGIVPTELDGALVSNDFPIFNISTQRLLPDYMGWLCRTLPFVDMCLRTSEGTTNRVRLKELEFLDLEIQLPSIDEQRNIVAKIDAVEKQLRQAQELRTSIDRDISSLLVVRFQETLKNAEWRPLKDVAPLIRRDIKVDHQADYAELGVRSFGKGTFHKPTLSGMEIGDKRVYKIEPGDLLFSNVFAWEGAIAVVKPEDAGRIGSHRFISCVPTDGLATAEYLRYYFLTEEGIAKIRDASPGGAGRNRTLGLNKLMELKVPYPSNMARVKFVEFKQHLMQALENSQSAVSATSLLIPGILNKIFADSTHSETLNGN
ncbi:MAG: restriction endonuclease subunit S domain-containing protein [Sulfuriferula sp.]